MVFKQGLNEYSDDIPLLKWNSIQKVLWQDICKDKKWEYDDMEKFMKFAAFFDQYYKQYKRFPTVQQSGDAVMSESLVGYLYSICEEDIHTKAYKKTLKSKGKKPYLTWVNNIKGKI